MQQSLRTYGVNQAFRFVEGIWLHRKSHQIRFFFRKITLFTNAINVIVIGLFSRKKIEFDDSLDVTKCLQQIEMPDLLHVFA